MFPFPIVRQVMPGFQIFDAWLYQRLAMHGGGYAWDSDRLSVSRPVNVKVGWAMRGWGSREKPRPWAPWTWSICWNASGRRPFSATPKAEPWQLAWPTNRSSGPCFAQSKVQAFNATPEIASARRDSSGQCDR